MIYLTQSMNTAKWKTIKQQLFPIINYPFIVAIADIIYFWKCFIRMNPSKWTNKNNFNCWEQQIWHNVLYFLESTPHQISSTTLKNILSTQLIAQFNDTVIDPNLWQLGLQHQFKMMASQSRWQLTLINYQSTYGLSNIFN